MAEAVGMWRQQVLEWSGVGNMLLVKFQASSSLLSPRRTFPAPFPFVLGGSGFLNGL